MKKLTGAYLIIDALLPFIVVGVLISLYVQYISTVKSEYTQVSELISGIKQEGRQTIAQVAKAKANIDHEFCKLDNSVIHLRNSARALQHFSNNICTGKPLTLKPARPRECPSPASTASLNTESFTEQLSLFPRDSNLVYPEQNNSNNYMIKTSLLDGAKKTAGDVGSFINRNIIDKGEDVFRGIQKGVIKTPQIACSGVTAPFKFIAGELRKTMVPFQYINNSLIHFAAINKQLSKKIDGIKTKTQEANTRFSNLVSALMNFLDYFFWLILFIAVWYLFRYCFVMLDKLNRGFTLLLKE